MRCGRRISQCPSCALDFGMVIVDSDFGFPTQTQSDALVWVGLGCYGTSSGKPLKAYQGAITRISKAMVKAMIPKPEMA
jgi:hypothetical protein